MPAAIETSTALYLYGAEPTMTAIALRQEQVIPTERKQIIIRGWQPPQSQDQPAESQGEYLTATSSPSGATSTAPDATIPSEEPKTLADRTIAQLVQFEALDADWDGNEAAKPLPFSLKDAQQFVRALTPESVIPRPTLHADGHAILFVRGLDTYAELEFLGNKRISFYARRGGQEWSDEIDFAGRPWPAALSQIGLAV